MNTQYAIDKFRIKKGEQYLQSADFEYWPAWSEHYDFEEIETITSWGIDREWVLGKFAEYDTGGAHPHYTILDLANLPLDNMRIFLRATFTHTSGAIFDGYVMNKGDLCISLFSDTSEYIFSKHPALLSTMIETQRKAEQDFGVAPLFPLQYTTMFQDEKGALIQGEYNLSF